jgi:hypothetical protein
MLATYALEGLDAVPPGVAVDVHTVRLVDQRAPARPVRTEPIKGSQYSRAPADLKKDAGGFDLPIGNTDWDVAAKLTEHLERSLRPPGTPDLEQRELFEKCLDFTLNTLVNWNTIVHILKTRHPGG